MEDGKQDAIKSGIKSRIDHLDRQPDRGLASDKAAITVLAGGLCCHLRTTEGAVAMTDIPTQLARIFHQ